MTGRKKFEAWAAEPPREWDVELNGKDQGWPDQYRAYHVQCAWDAWQARALSVEEGCTETDAKMLRTTNHKLIAENEYLKALLKEAAEDIKDWGGYASDYLQDKHNLKSDIEKYREAGK